MKLTKADIKKLITEGKAHYNEKKFCRLTGTYYLNCHECHAFEICDRNSSNFPEEVFLHLPDKELNIGCLEDFPD